MISVDLRFFRHEFRISHRKFAAATFLNAGTLAWFFLLYYYFTGILQRLTPNDSFLVFVGQILFYSSAVFWAIVGSLVAEKINRRKLLLSWISLGVFATILLALFQGTIFSLVSSSLLGLSLGLGLPTSMTFIADWTVIEERARVSGTIILATFIMAFAVIATQEILGIGIIATILLLTIIRSTSFFALIFDKCDKPAEKEKPRLPSTAYREFSFYLFPWVMFNVAAGLALILIPQTPSYSQAFSDGRVVEYACIAIFGLITGLAADRFGRKQPIIIGLIMLGVGFALLGFLSLSPMSVFIYLVASGVSWGSFFVVFLAVPGDLSVSGSREKFYAMGTILPLTILLSLSTVPGSSLKNVSASAFSQVLSLILFLSIIPILRAKETLAESKIQARKMKEYLNKLGKVVQESKKSN